MFKVQIDEDEYEVKFTHYQPQDVMVSMGMEEPGTICKIVRLEGHVKLVYMGSTRLHPKDNYNKNIGRKESLKKALKWGNTYDVVNGQRIGRPFNKDERTIFWKEYFEVRGKTN